MAFKKILLSFPTEGFTGETVKHTVTKTNITNQPELSEKGIKVGDEIDIVKPVAEEPLTGDSAATKTVTTKVKKDVAVQKKSEEEVIVRGNPKRAREIADSQAVDEVFENHLGEFYTSKNLALLSVNQVKSKIITHIF